MVDSAEATDASASVVVLEATWSANQPITTRPSTLVACITAIDQARRR